MILYLADLLFAFIFRWSAGIGPYSGQGKAPMFGDYEAQRHWMEISYNLPLEQWYHNTSENDLLYWGLDYPPLTAYHSYLLGMVADRINSSWVALGTSRGLESYDHKVFMRATVVIADLLVYIPAVFVYVLSMEKVTAARHRALLTILMYPGMILIDNCHFQYNCISLGFFLWAVISILKDRNLLACICFVSALNYKQMELYHAMPFFCYLLGSALRQRRFGQKIGFLLSVAVVTLTTFLVIWFPFIRDPSQIAQVLHRVFPVDRGLFEDKVANVWCSLTLVVKLRNFLTNSDLVLLSSVATLTALLPSSVMLLWRPSKKQFKLALVNSSLAFFLFSYQVHEKSILLVAIPVLLVLDDRPVECCSFLLTSAVSLYPLCIKDGTEIAFYALTIPYAVWLWDAYNISLWRSELSGAKKGRLVAISFNFSVAAACLNFGVGLVLCGTSALVKPPARLPHLFDVLISALSCLSFVQFGLLTNYLQYCAFTQPKLKTK